MSKYAPLSQQLERTHIDKRILPLFDSDMKSRNISVQSKYFDQIMPVGQNYNSKTQSFLINADSSSMISLSESFFVANVSIAQAKESVSVPQPTSNFTLAPFASSLFLDNIRTRISNIDVSDIHSNGLYANSAFAKKLLMKPSEPDTKLVLQGLNASVGDGPNELRYQYQKYTSSQGKEASTTLDSLGDPTQTLDDAQVMPYPVHYDATGDTASVNYNVQPFINANAMWYKNLIGPEYTLDPANQVVSTANPNFEFKICPQDGVWLNQSYIPTSTQVQVDLSIADIRKWFIWQNASDVPAVSINSLTLYLCRVLPREDALLAVNSALNQSPFKYNIFHSRTESYQIPAGSSLVNLAGILSGVIPNAVMVNVISSTTFTRDPTRERCPPLSSGLLRMENEAPVVQRMWLNVGSEKYPKSSQYLTNSSQGTFSSVQATYDEYRRSCMDADQPYLSYLHWLNQYTTYVFNLTNDDSPIYASTDQTRTGSLNLNVQFENTTVDYTIVIVALQHATFYIDKTRNVSRDGF